MRPHLSVACTVYCLIMTILKLKLGDIHVKFPNITENISPALLFVNILFTSLGGNASASRGCMRKLTPWQINGMQCCQKADTLYSA